MVATQEQSRFNRLRVGDRVTNSKGWHGIIDRISKETASGNDYQTIDGQYYWVFWVEREQHKEKLVRKQPICGHTRDQIWKDDRPLILDVSVDV
jgi:hypothetical protein